MIINNKVSEISAKEITENLVLGNSVTHLVIKAPIDLAQMMILGTLLKNNNTVTNITLWSNQIGAEGAEAIADALKVNNTVTNITLWSNQIGAEGAKAIADALKVNHTVTNISIYDTDICDEEVRESFANALTKNRLKVEKLADFLVKEFGTKKDYSSQDITKNASALKYYQVANKELLQEYVEQSLSNNKSDTHSGETISFTELCNNVKSYINSHYFHLAAICKTFDTETGSINSLPHMPQDLCRYVSSLLGSHSLWEESNLHMQPTPLNETNHPSELEVSLVGSMT